MVNQQRLAEEIIQADLMAEHLKRQQDLILQKQELTLKLEAETQRLDAQISKQQEKRRLKELEVIQERKLARRHQAAALIQKEYFSFKRRQDIRVSKKALTLRFEKRLRCWAKKLEKNRRADLVSAVSELFRAQREK